MVTPTNLPGGIALPGGVKPCRGLSFTGGNLNGTSETLQLLSPDPDAVYLMLIFYGGSYVDFIPGDKATGGAFVYANSNTGPIIFAGDEGAYMAQQRWWVRFPSTLSNCSYIRIRRDIG